MQAKDFKETDQENLADIIWWIKGNMSAKGTQADFCLDHIESLRKARVILKELNEKPVSNGM